jgi:hypothetical protein
MKPKPFSSSNHLTLPTTSAGINYPPKTIDIPGALVDSGIRQLKPFRVTVNEHSFNFLVLREASEWCFVAAFFSNNHKNV